MKSSAKFMCAVLLASALLVFGPNTARADSIPSDVLSVTFDNVNITRTILEVSGESVTEEIDFTLPNTTQFDTRNNTTVYLVEPGTVTQTFSDGTVQGDRSDYVRLNVSHEQPVGGVNVTELHFTINSDEDPGTHDPVIGYLETGSPLNITANLFGDTLGTHTAEVLVTSDGETAPVPEPATMLLLGSGLIGLAGYGRKKLFKK